jgi:uncharacterized protein DUF2599
VRVVLAAAVTAASAILALAPVASAEPVPDPPYVDHVQWATSDGLSSLRVYPTDAARGASVHPGTDAAADEAWSEVLTLSPDADTPGMQAQFLCHWHYAELVEPGKVSWNLEPWRKVVSEEDMVASGCNPGGPEEPF